MNYKQAKIADSAKVAKETVLVGNITIHHSIFVEIMVQW